MTFKRVLASVFFVILRVPRASPRNGAARTHRGAHRRSRRPVRSWARRPPRPPPMVDASGLAQIGARQRQFLHRGKFSARRHRREGGDGAVAAGLALVLGDHHQQVDRAGRPQAQGAPSSKRSSGRASRWTSFISNSPPATIIPWRRCSWRPCANGAAPSKAARRAKARSPGIKERIEKAMSVTILRETDGIERQLGFLATVGSVAPFIGLFGTVWGIMNSLLRHRRAP